MCCPDLREPATVCDPRPARPSQRHADGEVLRALGAEQSRFSGAASQQKGKFITQIITQNGFCTFSGIKNGEGEVPLTDSFERCYVPEVALLAGVAKLAYAADSKSAGVHSPWGFKSLLRHSTTYK